MILKGSCHCGNISFQLDWKSNPAFIPARECNCSLCKKHGNIWTSIPDGTLNIIIQDRSRLSIYEFETKTAQFHVCSTCGVVPVATSLIDSKLYAVININTLTNVDSSILRGEKLVIRGEDQSERLERRKHNWIGDVDIK